MDWSVFVAMETVIDFAVFYCQSHSLDGGLRGAAVTPLFLLKRANRHPFLIFSVFGVLLPLKYLVPKLLQKSLRWYGKEIK